MVVTDPIADMLTTIRNGLAVRKSFVLVPASKIKLGIAQILQQQGYIEGVSSQADPKGHPQLKIDLKYFNDKSVIQGIKRISSPGQKIYHPKKHLTKVLGGVGTKVISTSSGLMTDKEARAKGIGGEVLFKIW